MSLTPTRTLICIDKSTTGLTYTLRVTSTLDPKVFVQWSGYGSRSAARRCEPAAQLLVTHALKNSLAAA